LLKGLMTNKLKTLMIQEWIIRVQEPESNGPHPVIWLFHGWRGDEDSMSIFTSLLPKNYLILIPRGIYSAPKGGYSWVSPGDKKWLGLDSFIPALQKIKDLEENWPLNAPWADFNDLRVAGFSQGAALAYTYTLMYPMIVKAVAGLAGFLPEKLPLDDSLDKNNYSKIKVFISHGTKDRLVPIEKAKLAAQVFTDLGAEVTFCESDVSHKLSKDCFKGLEVFFN
jgi:phospholipase/carboxylesterase